MSTKNRTEAKAIVNAWTPILDLEADHKPDLQEILDNCVFRKDVSDSDTASGTTKTLDFDGFDYIEVTQSNDVSYTLNNIQQGEIKYLKITKTATQTIAFANATDVSMRKTYINEKITTVIYRIINKDASLYVESVNIDNNINELLSKVIEIGTWDMNVSASGTTNPSSGNPAHGISDAVNRIRYIEVAIIDDSGTSVLDGKSPDQNGNQGLSVGWSATVVGLNTFIGNKFDTTAFDDTSSNRGYCTIFYTP